VVKNFPIAVLQHITDERAGIDYWRMKVNGPKHGLNGRREITYCGHAHQHPEQAVACIKNLDAFITTRLTVRPTTARQTYNPPNY
jgi:hypothetical protein